MIKYVEESKAFYEAINLRILELELMIQILDSKAETFQFDKKHLKRLTENDKKEWGRIQKTKKALKQELKTLTKAKK